MMDPALWGVDTLDAAVELEISEDVVDDDVAEPEMEAAGTCA
jgi:hypothetical protein